MRARLPRKTRVQAGGTAGWHRFRALPAQVWVRSGGRRRMKRTRAVSERSRGTVCALNVWALRRCSPRSQLLAEKQIPRRRDGNDDRSDYRLGGQVGAECRREHCKRDQAARHLCQVADESTLLGPPLHTQATASAAGNLSGQGCAADAMRETIVRTRSPSGKVGYQRCLWRPGRLVALIYS
jgi:hypothetical protein